MQELATIVDQKAPIKIAIMNNGCLGMIRQWQELFYDNNLVAADLRQELCQPDFVKLADAYGIKALRVTDKEGVRPAIEEANAYAGPIVIDFRVRQEENVWPMVPAGASLAETVEEPREKKVRA
jgi:acetolactate synthase I/II/III large subunit